MTQENNNKPKASDKLLQRAKEFEKKLKTAKTVDEKMELVLQGLDLCGELMEQGYNQVCGAIQDQIQKTFRVSQVSALNASKSKKPKMLAQLAKLKSKKALATLAILGVVALTVLFKSHDKAPSKTAASREVAAHNRTMAVLAVLAEDPHAFDGIEINDSMAADSLMMNTKVLDAVDGAFQRAGLTDKDGNLKPMKMIDVSEADALGVLQKGLRAPNIYRGK